MTNIYPNVAPQARESDISISTVSLFYLKSQKSEVW